MSEPKYIAGRGAYGANLMIIGDCPSQSDLQSNQSFSNTKELDRLLKEAGIHKDNCWMTYASKFYVPPNLPKAKIPFAIRAKNAGVDIPTQLAELQNEIAAIKPNCILAVGKTALWALTGKLDIGSYRGSILHGMGSKVVATYNPAHLSWQASDVEFIGYWNRQIMLFDIKRAYIQSQFPEYILPSRTLQICNSSYELMEFWNRYKLYPNVGVDIEANGTCAPVCMGLAFNKNHGMTVPLWNAGGLSSIPDADMVSIWLILSEILLKHGTIGQNFNYDRDKIRRLGFIIRKLVSDIMLKGFAINPELPKNLGFFTSIYTEEPFYKNEGMYQGSTKDLFLGCARDACVTVEVNENMDPDIDELNMRPFFENFLMQLPDMYLDIQNQGFNIDPTGRDALIRKYIAWDELNRFELFQITGTEINTMSPKQISSLLFDNFKLPRRMGTGEEEITALLNSPSAIKKEEHKRVCELILENRRVRKTIGTYLMALPDFDGRLKTTYFLCLETGRTSTGQQDPPIRPKIEDLIDENGKKKDKILGTAFQTMTKHGDIGADVRSMYIPDNPDYEIFVQADSAQAEARVVFLLANDEQALIDIDTRDYHALTASWFFGGSESDYSKKVLGYESPIRFAGKTLRHAGHLGAGKKRAAISVNTDARKYKIPIKITEDIAEHALRVFHQKQPKIQQVFHNGIVDCLKKNRQLIAPVPYGANASIGGQRIFFERWGDELFRQAFSYIPQRSISDNTKMAGLRLRKRIPGIKIVMESHDALLFCIPKSKLAAYAPIIKEEFERPIDFTNCSLPRRPLVIPCEIETGHNYKEFAKFRDLPIVVSPNIIPSTSPRSITDEFMVDPLPKESALTEIIYNAMDKTDV